MFAYNAYCGTFRRIAHALHRAAPTSSQYDAIMYGCGLRWPSILIIQKGASIPGHLCNARLVPIDRRFQALLHAPCPNVAPDAVLYCGMDPLNDSRRLADDNIAVLEGVLPMCLRIPIDHFCLK